MKIEKVAVFGAGEMGHGIAENCAIAGYEVWMRDLTDEALNRAMARIKEGLLKLQARGIIKNTEEILERINPTTELENAIKDADLLIEAIPEVFEQKVNLFSECDKIARDECIFATNTSTMSITRLSEATKRRDRFIGMHFFTPVVVMELVELTKGEKTSEETLKVCEEFVKTLKKRPIVLKKETLGFIKKLVPRKPRALALMNGQGLNSSVLKKPWGSSLAEGSPDMRCRQGVQAE